MKQQRNAPFDIKSLVDKVYEYLLQRIIEGKIKYGETINTKMIALDRMFHEEIISLARNRKMFCRTRSITIPMQIS